MDAVTRQLVSCEWKYAPQDPAALEELTRRIEDAARREGLINYSDLVQGLTFHLSTVNDGRPFEIDTHSWTELHRRILGGFLGSIAANSYVEHGFLASAVAVSKETRNPSEPFFAWAHGLGLLEDNTELGRLAFWNDQLKRAYRTYGRA